MRHNCAALSVAVSVLGAGALLQGAASASDCGVLVNMLCPSCPSNPSDTTCTCGLNSTSCDCIKTSGGIQAGLLASCQTANFSWTATQFGNLITPGEMILCAEFKKCTRANGNQTGCAPYSAGPPASCGTPINGGCSWRDHTVSTAREFLAGGACENENW